jgi:hypothetical protein
MKKTWHISGAMAGAKIARAGRTDLRAIRPGEDYLGIPFLALKVGSFVEEHPTLAERLAADPRFVKGESGIAFIIVGAKPSV